MSQLVRVHNFGVSSDGFGAGEGQSLERPFGHADPAELFSWAGATAHWANRTEAGGTYGLDDYCTRDFTNNIGAEIMGRAKFGPQTGPWSAVGTDDEWRGWWGPSPRDHRPTSRAYRFHARTGLLGNSTLDVRHLARNRAHRCDAAAWP